MDDDRFYVFFQPARAWYDLTIRLQILGWKKTLDRFHNVTTQPHVYYSSSKDIERKMREKRAKKKRVHIAKGHAKKVTTNAILQPENLDSTCQTRTGRWHKPIDNMRNINVRMKVKLTATHAVTDGRVCNTAQHMIDAIKATPSSAITILYRPVVSSMCGYHRSAFYRTTNTNLATTLR